MIALKAYLPDHLGQRDVVEQWYQEMEGKPKVRARLDGRMIFLRQQPREGWIREPYDTLRDGVGEVRFKAEGVWYRPLGYFGPFRNEFTFLFFATKTNKFIPSNAIDIAVERMKVVELHPARAVHVKRWGQE